MKFDIAEEHLQLIIDALPETGVLLELGSGGSTKWFGDRLGDQQRLVSVEQDREWWSKVVETIYDNTKVTLMLAELDEKIQQPPYGAFLRENPTGANGFINAYPYDQADVVFIDGYARGACLATALYRCEPGTRIFLHDSQRSVWYGWAMELAPEGSTVVHPPAEGHPSEMWECKL